MRRTCEDKERYENLKTPLSKISLMRKESLNFSCLTTPQQNSIVEWKSITLREIIRILLEAINTAYYILFRVSIKRIMNITSYECWKGRKPNTYIILSCFWMYWILGKFDGKLDKAIFL
ncbi:hypothetical protein CR513_27336, partial [Mucuna pruriens]